jgi:hypothetical protein
MASRLLRVCDYDVKRFERAIYHIENGHDISGVDSSEREEIFKAWVDFKDSKGKQTYAFAKKSNSNQSNQHIVPIIDYNSFHSAYVVANRSPTTNDSLQSIDAFGESADITLDCSDTYKNFESLLARVNTEKFRTNSNCSQHVSFAETYVHGRKVGIPGNAFDGRRQPLSGRDQESKRPQHNKQRRQRVCENIKKRDAEKKAQQNCMETKFQRSWEHHQNHHTSLNAINQKKIDDRKLQQYLWRKRVHEQEVRAQQRRQQKTEAHKHAQQVRQQKQHQHEVRRHQQNMAHINMKPTKFGNPPPKPTCHIFPSAVLVKPPPVELGITPPKMYPKTAAEKLQAVGAAAAAAPATMTVKLHRKKMIRPDMPSSPLSSSKPIAAHSYIARQQK